MAQLIPKVGKFYTWKMSIKLSTGVKFFKFGDKLGHFEKLKKPSNLFFICLKEQLRGTNFIFYLREQYLSQIQKYNHYGIYAKTIVKYNNKIIHLFVCVGFLPLFLNEHFKDHSSYDRQFFNSMLSTIFFNFPKSQVVLKN